MDPVGCAAGALEDHNHEVDITFVNVTLAGTIGIGRGFAVHAQLPFDRKVIRRRYTTADGDPFVPPYGDIHHRNETLSGIGDVTLSLRRDMAFGGSWRLGVQLGTTIPLGDTTENPDPLAEQSLTHQHMQIGSGTFDPVTSLNGGWSRGRFGVFGRVDARVPVYESSKGYRGGLRIGAAVGPGYRIGGHHFVFAQLGVSHNGEELWDGEPNENSGRTTSRLILGGHFGIGHNIRIGPVVQIELANRAVGGDFDQPFIGTLTVSYGKTESTGGEL